MFLAARYVVGSLYPEIMGYLFMNYRKTVVIFSVLCVVLGSNCAKGQDMRGSSTDAGMLEGQWPLGLWSWSAEETIDALFVTIERRQGEWRARLDSEFAAMTHDRGVISIVGPDGSRFLGELSSDESEIRGYWYQTPAPTDYQYVATPTAFPVVADGRWQADVVLQPRPYRIFLDVFEGENAEIFAALRNPEGNNIHRASRFRLETNESNGWILVAGSGDYERRYGLNRAAGGGLLLEYNRFDEPILLKPATNTKGYYSRRDDDVPASATSLPAHDDGWVVVTPEEAGFDPDGLAALTEELSNVDPRSRRPQMIHAMLVSHRGQLVYEEYFFGHDRETRHDIRSLGKVFGSVLVGALQQQGHAIDASHRPIPDVLERSGQPLDDPRKADITLGHLLTFTSGLDCDASSDDSRGSEWRMWEQQEEDDYWLFTSQLEMLHDPGKRYAYCSGSANLVGASLSAFGGAPVQDLFDELIARPLDFGPYHFALSPNSEGYLGGGAYVQPRDILKIGAMYLAGGAWNGKQIVDGDWIEESTKPHIAISPETTGMTQDNFENNYFGGSQAYIWRVDTVISGERSFDSYEASGNGGQLLIVVPELELAVVFSGGNYRVGGIWGRWRNEIIGGHIIPAMKGY